MKSLLDSKSGPAVRWGLVAALAVASLFSWQYYRSQVHLRQQAQHRLERCWQMARELKILASDEVHLELGSGNYEPGPDVFTVLQDLDVPVGPQLSVTKGFPQADRESRIARVPVNVPALELTTPQVFRFMDALRTLPVPHHFLSVELRALAGGTEEDDSPDRWQATFQVVYYIPAAEMPPAGGRGGRQ